MIQVFYVKLADKIQYLKVKVCNQYLHCEVVEDLPPNTQQRLVVGGDQPDIHDLKITSFTRAEATNSGSEPVKNTALHITNSGRVVHISDQGNVIVRKLSTKHRSIWVHYDPTFAYNVKRYWNTIEIVQAELETDDIDNELKSEDEKEILNEILVSLDHLSLKSTDLDNLKASLNTKFESRKK